MQQALYRFGRWFLVAGVATAFWFGASVLSANRAHAAPAGPLCGPTYLWLCTFPDGTVKPFAGTVCQKAAYEKKTGAKCVAGP